MLLKVTEVLFFVGHPDHCRVSTSLQVAEKTRRALINAAKYFDDQVDAAAFFTTSSKHLFGFLLLARGHVWHHHHVSLQGTAEEASKQPAHPRLRGRPTRVEDRDVGVDLHDGLVLLLEHAAPDYLVFKAVRDYKLVDFHNTLIVLFLHINRVHHVLWQILEKLFEQGELAFFLVL